MKTIATMLTMLALFYIGGCGGENSEKENKNFFTSGDKEADQCAEQRMAQSQQLKGNTDQKSLYDRLGGQPGIQAIADDFVTHPMADPRVNFTRKGIEQGGFSIHAGRSETWNSSPENVKALEAHLAEFLALSSGGPSEYHGKEIADTHKDMHITNAEFDASVGDLKASMDKLQIPNKEQKELLAIVETTRAQIVQER